MRKSAILFLGLAGTISLQAAIPVANPDTFTIQDIRKSINLPNPRLNDTDGDGDTLTIVRVGKPGRGSATLNTQNGSQFISYKTGPGFAGTDNFSYVISDGTGNQTTGNITIYNPFPGATGTYSGPIMPATGTPTHSNSGYIQMTVNGEGYVTGSIRYNGQTRRFRERLSIGGQLNRLINFDTGGADLILSIATTGVRTEITGSLGGLPFSAKRNVFSTERPASTSDYYTVHLPPPSGGTTLPKGCGYARVNIGPRGGTRIVGRLADGAPISTGTQLAPDSKLPIYAPIYRGKGSVFGSLTTSVNLNTKQITGNLSWKRPAQTLAKLFRTGFETSFAFVGSKYVEVPSDSFLFRGTLADKSVKDSVSLTIAGDVFKTSPVLLGTLSERPASGAWRAVLTDLAGKTKIEPTLVVSPKTGIVTGSFRDPSTKRLRRFAGVFLSDEKKAYGVFTGNKNTGRIIFEQYNTIRLN